MRSIDNIEILAGADIVGARHDSLCVPPVLFGLFSVGKVLDVTGDERSKMASHDVF